MSDGAVVHIAGSFVYIGSLLRQRCAWCGAVLIDYDLERIAVPVGQDAGPGVWPVGELVMVDGPLCVSVPHDDGDMLPDNACARLDPAITT